MLPALTVTFPTPDLPSSSAFFSVPMNVANDMDYLATPNVLVPRLAHDTLPRDQKSDKRSSHRTSLQGILSFASAFKVTTARDAIGPNGKLADAGVLRGTDGSTTPERRRSSWIESRRWSGRFRRFSLGSGIRMSGFWRLNRRSKREQAPSES